MNIELASLNYFIFWSKNQLNHDCSDECKTRLAFGSDDRATYDYKSQLS